MVDEADGGEGMSDDITFCFNTKCENKKCERNPKNIRVHYIDHSFAFFKDCEYWNVPEEYYAPQERESGS